VEQLAEDDKAQQALELRHRVLEQQEQGLQLDKGPGHKLEVLAPEHKVHMGCMDCTPVVVAVEVHRKDKHTVEGDNL